MPDENFIRVQNTPNEFIRQNYPFTKYLSSPPTTFDIPTLLQENNNSLQLYENVNGEFLPKGMPLQLPLNIHDEFHTGEIRFGKYTKLPDGTYLGSLHTSNVYAMDSLRGGASISSYLIRFTAKEEIFHFAKIPGAQDPFSSRSYQDRLFTFGENEFIYAITNNYYN